VAVALRHRDRRERRVGACRRRDRRDRRIGACRLFFDSVRFVASQKLLALRRLSLHRFSTEEFSFAPQPGGSNDGLHHDPRFLPPCPPTPRHHPRCRLHSSTVMASSGSPALQHNRIFLRSGSPACRVHVTSLDVCSRFGAQACTTFPGPGNLCTDLAPG
jgi:hypothetical protein